MTSAHDHPCLDRKKCKNVLHCFVDLTLAKFYLPCKNRIIDVQKIKHQNNYIKYFNIKVLQSFQGNNIIRKCVIRQKWIVLYTISLDRNEKAAVKSYIKTSTFLSEEVNIKSYEADIIY